MSNYDMDEIERQREIEKDKAKGEAKRWKRIEEDENDDQNDDHIVAQPDTHPHPTWVYDTNNCTENISLDISDQDMLQLTMIAHDRDITLNHLINEVLHDKIQRDLLQHSR